MRRFLVSMVLLQAIAGGAQVAADRFAGDGFAEDGGTRAVEGANWAHVQALPVDQNVKVQAQGRSVECRIKHVDAETLTCVRHLSGQETVFQRSDVKSIKLPHRGRSTLVGTAAGVGVGAVIGFAVGTSPNDGFFGKNFLRGAVTAVFGVGGGVVGAPLGYFTDFTRSTVYKAP